MVPRFARVLRIAAVLAFVGGLGAALLAAAPSPLKKWRDGPVRLLLTAAEYGTFGELRTDDERRSFIDAFWVELEASPDGAKREFRATFEKRCEVADRRFPTIHEPGWATIRGRVYIVLGEPTTIRHESGGPKAVEKEVWVYAGTGEPGAGLEIAFYRCSDGTYRTDPSCLVIPNTNSVAFDWERANYLATLRNLNPDVSAGRVKQMLLDLLAALPQNLSATPPPRAAAPAAAPQTSATGGPASAGRLDVAPCYFRALDGTVLVFVTLAMRAEPAPSTEDGASYLAAASFEKLDRRGSPVADAAVHTTPLTLVPGDGASPAFFGRAYLESGKTYAARYALQDDRRGEILVKDDRLRVPDLKSGLSVSSLVLAERFGPASEGSGPYRVGSEEVVPRVGSSIRRSELLRLYLQVYGAAIDPARATPRVDVAFKFQQVVDGSPKTFGKPFLMREASGAAIGLALPVADWPLGPYRVRVELHDRVAGERVSVEGAFTIVE